MPGEGYINIRENTKCTSLYMCILKNCTGQERQETEEQAQMALHFDASPIKVKKGAPLCLGF
jgi:hypothetical protein